MTEQPYVITVAQLAAELHDFYGEGPDDTCWHDHDAEVILRHIETAPLVPAASPDKGEPRP